LEIDVNNIVFLIYLLVKVYLYRVKALLLHVEDFLADYPVG